MQGIFPARWFATLTPAFKKMAFPRLLIVQPAATNIAFYLFELFYTLAVVKPRSNK